MSSSDGRPRIARAARRVALGATLGCAFAPATAGAQGDVRGRVGLVERESDDAADLREALVWLEARGGAPRRAAARDGVIVMEGREFAPHVLAVPVGGAVSFPNADPFTHNVFSNS